MIRYIKGVFSEITDNKLIVETSSGIGFLINIPYTSEFYTKKEGDLITVYTQMIVREDDMSLYGFSDMDSLDMFNMLMTISGIGAKAALSILSALPLIDLKNAIVSGDSTLISKANGVGKKTAERVILELKDKIKDGIVTTVKPVISNKKNEAVSALISLGYSKNEAFNAVSAILEDDLSEEEYIKKALRNLM